MRASRCSSGTPESAQCTSQAYRCASARARSPQRYSRRSSWAAIHVLASCSSAVSPASSPASSRAQDRSEWCSYPRRSNLRIRYSGSSFRPRSRSAPAGSAAQLLDRGEAEPGDVEAVEHAGRGRESGAQRRGIRVIRIQRRSADAGPPAGLALRDPAAQRGGRAALDHVEQARHPAPAAGQVQDPGDERRRAGRGGGGECGLVPPTARTCSSGSGRRPAGGRGRAPRPSLSPSPLCPSRPLTLARPRPRIPRRGRSAQRRRRGRVRSATPAARSPPTPPTTS